MKFAFLVFAALALVQAADTAYIVGMYSSKDTRGLGGRFLMKVDDKKVASLRYPTYYRLEVPPGVYNVTMDDKDRPPDSLPFDCRGKLLHTGETGGAR